MGASDYMVGNAPGGMSYGAGNFARQLFDMIGGLPQDYAQGAQSGFAQQQNRRTQQQQDMFKGGLPVGPNGQPDYSAMIRQMIETGGAPAAGQLIPQLLGQQANQAINSQLTPQGSSDQSQSPREPIISPTAQTPAMLDRGGGGKAQSSPTDGGDTINSIAAEHHVNLDAFLQRYPGAKNLLNKDLSPGQAKAITQRMADFDKGGGDGQAGGGPVGAAGGSPISPAPAEAAGSPAQQARGTPVGTESEARRLLERAHKQEAASALYGASPKAAEAALAAAKGNRERAKEIFDSLGKYNEPTTELKNVTSGALERSDQIKADTKYYDSLHKGLAGSGMIAAQQKQNIDMLRQVAAAPSFAPGAGSDLWLAYQRAAAGFGINPTGAAPREIFNQVSARILADQFSGMKSMAAETGETGARIFKLMLDIEEKANITPGDTLDGIKAKLDLFDKTGDLMMKWADKADDYKVKHGRLDAGFDKELRADVAKSRIMDAVPKAASAGPPVGHVEQGYRFKGGDPRDRKSWEPVAAGDKS